VALDQGHFASRPSTYVVHLQPGNYYQENLQTGFHRDVQRFVPQPPAPVVEEKLDDSIFVLLSLEEVKEEVCGICLSEFEEKDDCEAYRLAKCEGRHFFHKPCVGTWILTNKQCPICKARYGVQTGTQPTNGKLTIRRQTESLGGYEGHGMIEITYHFSGGVQGPEHPMPGKRYPGTTRVAYLPDNDEGKQVLKLLEEAWKRRLIFAIGTSVTRGVDNQIVWNGIHHKTNPWGGPENYGYPDPTYLTRVKEELKEKGVE